MNTKPITVNKIIIPVPPKPLHCSDCNRETIHDYNRVGARGAVYVCRCCGKEKTA